MEFILGFKDGWHKLLHPCGVHRPAASTSQCIQHEHASMRRTQACCIDVYESRVSCIHASDTHTVTPSCGGLQAVKLGAADVEKKGDGYVLKTNSEVRVDARSHKMSKSRGKAMQSVEREGI